MVKNKMGEEINIIIDNLCTKFGTTLQNLIPEMAKVNIAEDIVTIIICAIVSIVMYKIFKKGWKCCQEEDVYDKGEYIFMVTCAIVIGAIFGIILSCSIVDLTGWIASPTAKTIREIVSMIN